jgi:hypothetical protein
MYVQLHTCKRRVGRLNLKQTNSQLSQPPHFVERSSVGFYYPTEQNTFFPGSPSIPPIPDVEADFGENIFDGIAADDNGRWLQGNDSSDLYLPGQGHPPTAPAHPQYGKSPHHDNFESLESSTSTLGPSEQQLHADRLKVPGNQYTRFINGLPPQQGPTQSRTFLFYEDDRSSMVSDQPAHAMKPPVVAIFGHQHQSQHPTVSTEAGTSRRMGSEYAASQASAVSSDKRTSKQQCDKCEKWLANKDGLRYVN